ncbi:MAG TPA: hypothetical protein VM933_07680 [Acidimicrobiales bacterium]|nr:hypothetical protein [Acidimicrobiales bacterium]
MTDSSPPARTIRSLLRPLNRQLRLHVEEVSIPRLDGLSGQIDEVRQATVELRRLVTDDLDASNEVAALLGRTLQELSASVEALRAELAEVRGRLDRS